MGQNRNESSYRQGDIHGAMRRFYEDVNGPSDYNRPSRRFHGYARRHYTQDEVEQPSAQGSVDVLLPHDIPAGLEIAKS